MDKAAGGASSGYARAFMVPACTGTGYARAFMLNAALRDNSATCGARRRRFIELVVLVHSGWLALVPYRSSA